MSHWCRLLACVGMVCSVLDQPASATVFNEDREAAPPGATVMQAGDPLTLGAGARAVPGDLRLEYGALTFVISHETGDLIDVQQLYPQRRLGLSELGPVLYGGEDAAPGARGTLPPTAPPRRPIYTTAAAQRTGALATAVLEGYDSDNPALTVSTVFEVGPQLKAPDAMRITTTVRNTGKTPVLVQLGEVVRWGQLSRFSQGPGFGVAGPGAAVQRFLLGVGPGGTLLYLPDRSSPMMSGSEGALSSSLSTPRATPVVLQPGGSASLLRLVLFPRDLLGPLCTARDTGAPVVGGPILRGTVGEEISNAPLRAQVVLERPGGEAISVAASAADGTFAVCAPAGQYRLRALAPGRGLAREPLAPGKLPPALAVTLPAPKEVTLTLSRPGHLRVGLREAQPGHHSLRPAPGQVFVVGGGLDLPAVAGTGPLSALPGGISALTGSGELDLALPPGSYTVVAGRGPFYERTEHQVTVHPGEAARLVLNLRRGVPRADTQDMLCGVLRAQGRARTEAALLRARATDLDLVLSEDGRAQGSREVQVVRALEVRSGSRRIQLYPLGPRTTLPDLLATPTTQGLLDNLSQVAGEGGAPPLLQLALAGDKQVDVPQRIAAWEVWSAPGPAGVQERLAALLRQMQQGAVATAVGGVKQQFDDPADPLGSPRTCVGDGFQRSPTIGARLRAALTADEVQVTNGPWLRLRVNGAPVGGVARASDGQLTVKIAALAAPWVDLREIEVLVGGQVVQRIQVPETTAPLRYQGQVTLAAQEDTTVVVVGKGHKPLWPGMPALTPLGFTGPVFVDRNGDGRFTPPGVSRRGTR